MDTPQFTPEFKEEAVRQITALGYSVAEVSDLGIWFVLFVSCSSFNITYIMRT
ncbi:TPA: hypothetical protein QH070_005055 [Klebsiella aerogenes]|nr:hypothetical protein [Klebsiella aerogenes]HDT1383744.1 hypothetical protein [Klebsiella aerogenes]HDT4319773.1 hypothetical protein [Klebsiella aerogenes]HDU5289861.1 hypothetical protein [Klebsiella aerogenes]